MRIGAWIEIGLVRSAKGIKEMKKDGNPRKLKRMIVKVAVRRN